MSLPYFPMYPTDFEAKTSHLTLEEDGAYNRLLRLMWMTPGCSLPDDDRWIMRRMRVDQDTYDRVVLVVIDEFCQRKNGRVSNAKLTRVFDDSSEKHTKRVLAGSKGGKAKAAQSNNKMSSNAKAMQKQQEPEPEPEPYRTHAYACDADGVCVTADNIWENGFGYLLSTGLSDRSAKALVGKLIKDHGKEKAALGIESARAAGTADPAPYITSTITGTDAVSESFKRIMKNAQQ